MTEKKEVLKEKLEHTGIFTFSSMYSFAHGWFKEKDYGVNEDRYIEKIVGDKKEITVEWKIAKKLSDYFKSENKVKFEIKELVDVEVEIDGEKKKMNKGKITIEITGNLINDPDSKWETSPFTRFARDVYHKHVIPARVDHMEIEVQNDMRAFKNEIKIYLDLTGRA